ncbi:MAG: putative ABC transport system ATP-binding protein [Planctomycetota bacterium]|jgi:putative ABC transport system ATP-binding protein
MSPIAATHSLYKFHDQGEDKVPILKDVDLSIDEGEFVCVMGPSGSGKSTLLHLLSGLDEPSAGTVSLAGKDLSSLSEKERTLLRREQIGYVFQFFNLLPNLTVAENVSLPLSIAGKQPESASKQLADLAERLGITSRLAAFPHQLSGGEMQRTSIARALIGGQPLLLCDEPTGNLSQKAGAEVMELLRRCADEDGRAVMLVTHNPRDAAFADRVHFLVDGELVPDPVLRGPGIETDDVHRALTRLHI